MPEPLTPDELDYSTVRLGERPSDGEVYCGAGHPIRAGEAVYWPWPSSGEYDDRDPFCTQHARENAHDLKAICDDLAANGPGDLI